MSAGDSTGSGLIIDPNLGLSPDDKKKHDDALYGKAKIEREEYRDETAARANRALRDIAQFIQKDTPAAAQLKEMTYVGSASVHVYMGLVLGAQFICQTDPMTATCPEHIASAATEALRKNLMTAYGRTATKKRSGF